MPWKDVQPRDRWLLIAAWLQASATVGMFVIALVGIWQVAPIITYQILQQQEQRERRDGVAAKPGVDTVAGRYVADAFSWWGSQVASYRRIAELTGSTQAGLQVRYQLVVHGGAEIAAGMRPDLLVLTASRADGERETVSVPVNENAMSPSQYLQCKVNQGYFSELAPEQRVRVEAAVTRYLTVYMLPKAPPAFVRSGMSVRQLHDEIVLHQDEREKALEHIRALKAVLDDALAKQ